MRVRVVDVIDGETPLKDSLAGLSQNEKTSKRAAHLKERIDNFISKLPFTFNNGDYTITLKDIKLDGGRVGVWFYAKRNGEFVAAHSPFWVVDVPFMVQSPAVFTGTADDRTMTITSREDLLQSYIDTFIRYLDTCPLGDPIGDDVAVIYAHNDGFYYVDGRDLTFANIIGLSASDGVSTPTYEDPGFNSSTTTNQFSYLGRMAFIYDTSSLHGCTISSVTNQIFKLFHDDGLKVNGVRHIITQFSPADNQSLVAGDFDQCSGTLWSDRVDTAANDDQYYTWTWTAAGIAGINKSGYTSTFLREEDDVDGSFSGTWVSDSHAYIAVRMVENGSNLPYLTVTYSPAVPLIKRLEYSIAVPITSFDAAKDGSHIDLTWS
jgi:hypothetical protein